MAEQNDDPKAHAMFLARSTARLERLLIINAPQTIVQREIEVTRNRLRDLERALGVLGMGEAQPGACPESGKHCNVIDGECQTCGVVFGLPGPAHSDHPLRHYDRTCPACNPGVQGLGGGQHG